MNEHYLFSAVRAFNTLAVLVHLCYIPGKSYLDLLRLLLMLYNNNNNNNSNIYMYIIIYKYCIIIIIIIYIVIICNFVLYEFYLD